LKSFPATGEELIWIRPSQNERMYSLRSGSEEIGTLRWDSSSGSLARAATSAGEWTLKRVGYLQPRVSVRASGVSEDLAWFEPGVGGGGAVHLASGHLFRWSSNVWRAEWAWVNAAGKHGVKIHREFSARDRAGKVTVAAGVLPDRELPLLIILGWYLIILQTDDAALMPQG